MIEYDPERQRATHVESRMAVEFDRYGYPRERDVYFRLIWKGRTIPFEASYDFGENKIRQNCPDLGILEQRRERADLREQNFRIGSIGVDVDYIMKTQMPDFPDVFAALVHRAAKGRSEVWRVSVCFRPFRNFDRRWFVEG